MANNDLEKNVKLYQDSIKENLEIINDILLSINFKDKNLTKQYVQILKHSASQITQKWSSKKKYCRTLFIQRALQEYYPKQYTLISLQIDSLVNILDDLLDEDMNRKIKMLYMIEFSRIFSLHEGNCPEKFKQMLKKYINQLITLAVAEEYYQKMIQKESDFQKIVKISTDLLLCRAMDIDIFTKIGLAKFDIPINKKNIIEEAARIFRAINILKKDIDDISHDQENNIKTMTIIILLKNNIDFHSYITHVADKLNQKLKNILDNYESTLSSKEQFIIRNFYQMATDNQKSISIYD